MGVAPHCRNLGPDGTVFYLARTATQKNDKGRLALGRMVWQMADGSDALFEECLGPSSYAKGQGQAIRIWGLLIAGVLFIYVLPKDKVMNRSEYEKLIRTKFPGWIRSVFGKGVQPFLVQDHERCLWTHEPRQAMKDVGIQLLENFPKSSQDLNSIETAWRELRGRLAETEPAQMETREEFIIRLRLAVRWVNRNRGDYLAELCSNQKEKAHDVLNAVPPGSRTRW